MHIHISTVVILLPFLAAASPMAPRSESRITLHKRTEVSKAGDTVNMEVLSEKVMYSMAKMSRGFEAYEKNTGMRHPLDTAQDSLFKRSTGADPLTDYNEVLWYGDISVGTPPRTYTVDFDTGSSDLFLPGVNCTVNCDGHKRYNPDNSSTSTDQHKSFHLLYGDLSMVEGEQYNDTVSIAGLTATNQRLGSANTYSTGFAKREFPSDGLMGMAYKTISNYGANPVFASLVAQGQTDEPVFGFKLANSGSELFLGGTNRDLYTGEFTYTPVTRQAYWQVNMQNVKVNGTERLQQMNAVIDTGTTLVVGDSVSVAELYKSIPGALPALQPGGVVTVWTVPCDTIPIIGLTFGDTTFNISTETFNLGRDLNSQCVGGIAGYDMLEWPEPFWIVGDVFLRNVYTAFDMGKNQVGFATLA